jgi:hypothetical protein
LEDSKAKSTLQWNVPPDAVADVDDASVDHFSEGSAAPAIPHQRL